MSSKRVALLLAALFCLFAVTPTALFSQGTSSGTVAGTVTDPAGGAVSGATVTLTDTATNYARTATTNETGRYIFVSVPPGTYNVSINKTGFRVSRLTNQEVTVGAVRTLDIVLEIGSVAETVEVKVSLGAELQTMNATVGNTVSGEALLMLPNFGRDASTLATLQPGTNPTGETAGVNYDQNSFSLDGAQNTNDMDGSMNIYTPSFGTSSGATTGGQFSSKGSVPTGVLPTPVESIEEFKVNTNNQTADFNGSAGGQIAMVTKRGTNSYHGTLWEYYTDARFGGANTWDNNRIGRAITDNHRNRFGGNFGGKILPKVLGGETYLFLEYDGMRFPNSGTVTETVPSAALRAGIVQIRLAGCNSLAVNMNATAATAPTGVLVFPGSNTTCPGPASTAVPTSTFCGSTQTNNCDPRQLGINSVMGQIWSKFEPLPNTAGGDNLNTGGYISNISLPETNNYGVARLDHDFGSKWHLNAVYHYYHSHTATTSQVDIGGFFPGDKLGTAASVTNRPQVPALYAVGLTTNISNNVTNDLHVSYLRNFWQWLGPGIPAQLSTLGATLEPGGESATGVTVPYTIDNQNTRTRYWDGQDKMIRDDVSWLKGSHLFQFGGNYQRNFLQHQRNDNGGSIQASLFPVDILSSAATNALNFAGFIPPACSATITTNCLPAGTSTTNYKKYYAEALGIVTQSQELYTRKGTSLTLQPQGSNALAQSVVPGYNLYFSDTWRMKPTITLTYGLGYQIEMPPYELNGGQTTMVDQDGHQFTVESYLAAQQKAALNGQVYNPVIGFATVPNVPGGGKYPYNPFYKGFSPRVSAAWSPSFDNGIMGKAFGRNKTVIRGGYSRIFGRLNGVDLILVPLLAPGLLQATACQGPQNTSLGNGGCGGATPQTAFRIGTDGNAATLGPAPSTNLPQPFFPGVGGAPGAGAGEALDPNFQPSVSDQFDFTIQRELPNHMILEVGYIGRRLTHEYQPIDISAVPHMFTYGGQRFDNAWANALQAIDAGKPVPTQPFFEAALGGSNSAYCKGFGTCTAAVVANEGPNGTGNLSSGQGGNQPGPAVYDFWQDLTPSFVFGRTMSSSVGCDMVLIQAINPTSPVQRCQQANGIGINTTNGYGNYNALFVTLKTNNYHGLTAWSNFTWGRALGTQSSVQATSQFSVPDPWNLHNGYGPQPFDVRFIYNLTMLYQPSFYKNQHGIIGRLAGGWSFAPLFTARSGLPIEVNVGQGAGGDCQSFGESDCNFFGTDEGAVFVSAAAAAAVRGGGNSVHPYTSTNTQQIGVNGNSNGNLNMFKDPIAAFNAFREPILGLDTNPGSFALRGMPTWNLDMTVAKQININERFNMQFTWQVSNLLNHVQLNDPSLDINNPAAWGVISGQFNSPRAMEFGLRLHF
jgi:Carboxypeptidase regulatory-like domain